MASQLQICSSCAPNAGGCCFMHVWAQEIMYPFLSPSLFSEKAASAGLSLLLLGNMGKEVP